MNEADTNLIVEIILAEIRDRTEGLIPSREAIETIVKSFHPVLSARPSIVVVRNARRRQLSFRIIKWYPKVTK